MWIAKPLHALTPDELEAWRHASAGEPLAQTPGWAQAIHSLKIPAYLILSADEHAGGFVFETAPGAYECINGPFLQWDDPEKAPRQLATFAMAATKLGRGFKSLKLRPRWLKGQVDRRIKHLPVAPNTRDLAATLHIPVLPSPDAQQERITSRLRRTLAKAQKAAPRVTWLSMQGLPASLIQAFHERLENFASAREFKIPPLAWLSALTRNLPCWKGECAGAEILVAEHAGEAHYLFGHSGSDDPAFSATTLLHWRALDHCRSRGLAYYDLNGYVVDAPETHPYAGVNEFKAQWVLQEDLPRAIVEYEVPEFLIS